MLFLQEKRAENNEMFNIMCIFNDLIIVFILHIWLAVHIISFLIKHLVISIANMWSSGHEAFFLHYLDHKVWIWPHMFEMSGTWTKTEIIYLKFKWNSTTLHPILWRKVHTRDSKAHLYGRKQYFIFQWDLRVKLMRVDSTKSQKTWASFTKHLNWVWNPFFPLILFWFIMSEVEWILKLTCHCYASEPPREVVTDLKQSVCVMVRWHCSSRVGCHDKALLVYLCTDKK